MSDTKAWLLQFGPEHRAVVGQRELLHLDQAASRYRVPFAPAHCREVLYWQGRPVPLMDIAILLGKDNARTEMERKKYIGIVGYQTRDGAAPHYGALWLSQPPSLIGVREDQACSLSQAGSRWLALATACFIDDHGAVPVLDLRRAFASPHSSVAMPSPAASSITAQPEPAVV